MATHGARRLLTMADNVRSILAIEWLVAAQALNFEDRCVHRKHRTGIIHVTYRGSCF